MGVEGMQKVRSLNDRDTSLDIPKSGNGNDLIQSLHKRADIFRGVTLDGTGRTYCLETLKLYISSVAP